MRAIGVFLSRNWKPLLTMLFAVVAAGYGAVQDVKGEISSNTDAIEEMNIRHLGEIATTKQNVIDVRYDIGQIKCMLIAEAEEVDPMQCVANSESRFELRP